MTNSLHLSDAEKKAYRDVYAPNGTTDAQWEVFIGECQRRALVPGTHVVMQLRNSNEWDPILRQRVPVKRVAFITTINALRLIAERSCNYRGHGAFLYYYPTDDGSSIVSRIPGFDEKTGRQIAQRVHAVSGEFRRVGWEPQFVVARLDAYAQKKDDGTLTSMWANRTPEQLAKCLEALGLRTITPEECSGLYIQEEMGDDVAGVEVNGTTAQLSDKDSAAPPPLPLAVPAVNSAPSFPSKPADAAPMPQVPSDAEIHKPVDGITSASPTGSALKPAVSASGLFAQSAVEEGKAILHPVVMAPVQENAPTPAPVAAQPVPQAASGDVPATQKEREGYLGRAAKILRDVLAKLQPPLPNDKVLVKDYFLRQSGKARLPEISAGKWEELLQALERAGSPEAVAEIIKGGKL